MLDLKGTTRPIEYYDKTKGSWFLRTMKWPEKTERAFMEHGYLRFQNLSDDVDDIEDLKHVFPLTSN